MNLFIKKNKIQIINVLNIENIVFSSIPMDEQINLFSTGSVNINTRTNIIIVGLNSTNRVGVCPEFSLPSSFLFSDSSFNILSLS